MESLQLWRELEDLYAQFGPQPGGSGLAPPASESDLLAYEALLGYRLPDQIRAGYQRHNGLLTDLRVPGLFPGSMPDGWDSLAALTRRKAESQALEARLLQQSSAWRLDLLESRQGAQRLGHSVIWGNLPGPRRIPICDEGQILLCLDLDPGPGGTAAQLIQMDVSSHNAWLAPSFNTALEWLVSAWQNKRISFETGDWLMTETGQRIQCFHELAPLRCALPAGRRALNVIDEASRQDSAVLWRGLGELSQTVCPDHPTHGLAAPATVLQLLAAEAHIGFCLPDEWRLAYLNHDGQLAGAPMPLPHLFVPGFRWLSLAEMCCLWDETQARRQHLLSIQDRPYDVTRRNEVMFEGGVMHPRHCCQRRVPIGQSSEGLIYLDMDPGPSGSMGQIRGEDDWHAHSLQAAAQPLLHAWRAGRIDWQPQPGRWVWRDSGDALERIYDLDRPLQAAPWLDDEGG